MKKFLFLALFIPLFAVSQKPTVLSWSRYFPKNDKVLEFEKALKNHAAKYHTGDVKWRVYTIESGPDGGGYHVIEGPSTWDQIDKRGTLGTEHMNDFLKNVLPLTTEKNYMGYLVYREDLSSIQLTDFTDKISVTHAYPKPGRYASMEETLKLTKKVWDTEKLNIVVYEMSSSGPAQLIVVTRYKDGLKERDTRKPLKERFNAVHGDGSFDKYAASYADNIEKQWSEMLSFNAELSSK
jgi:hypothetical protein